MEDLFDTLTCWAKTVTNEAKFSKEVYSADLKIIGEKGEVGIQANILKVADEDKHCVEFVKTSGHKVSFNEYYSVVKQYFGGHVNATG